MIDQNISDNTAPPQRLVDQVADIKALLSHQRIPMVDMSRSGSLETKQIASPPTYTAPGTLVPLQIERLEGPIRAVPIVGESPRVSGFRYFLDGTQRTIPICRLGVTPLVVGLTAVGILDREVGREPRLMNGTLRISETWIVPRRTHDPNVDSLITGIESRGGVVVDPLDTDQLDPHPDYDYLVGDYGRLISHAYDVAGRLRQRQEQAVLDAWTANNSNDEPVSWIAVDGRLPTNTSYAVGIVKELLTQHLHGDEAIALFDLPQGCRTTAFRYVSNYRGSLATSTRGRTMWYMRLWNASGMDARHSLIRVETGHEVCSSEDIDEISRWILAERLPRATDDPRWPTLLYPIHYLERILKRRLAAITTGWPSI